jgi:hypothetical protein
MTICTFCSTKFINNVVLNRHQKTAKYCLKLQGIIESDKKQPEKIFECLDCFTVFKTKQNLNNHLSLCNATKIRMIKDEQIKNLEQEIDRYKKENNELKIKLDIYKSDHDCIQEIAKQPKTINTSNTLNNNKYMYLSPLFLTKENIKDVIETNFTKDNFLNGQKGELATDLLSIITVFSARMHGLRKYKNQIKEDKSVFQTEFQTEIETDDRIV